MLPPGKHRPKPLRVNKRTAFLYAINNSPLTERVNKPEEARLRTLTKCEADAIIQETNDRLANPVP